MPFPDMGMGWERWVRATIKTILRGFQEPPAHPISGLGSRNTLSAARRARGLRREALAQFKTGSVAKLAQKPAEIVGISTWILIIGYLPTVPNTWTALIMVWVAWCFMVASFSAWGERAGIPEKEGWVKLLADLPQNRSSPAVELMASERRLRGWFSQVRKRVRKIAWVKVILIAMP
jgi:hypothetical protein